MKTHAIFVGFYGPKATPSPYKAISCLLVNDAGEVVARGISICSPLDKFDKRKGQQVALGRAMKALDGEFRERWQLGYQNKWDLAVAGLGIWIPGTTELTTPSMKAASDIEDEWLVDRELEAVSTWRRHNLGPYDATNINP
jgi:hypothetical protein